MTELQVLHPRVAVAERSPEWLRAARRARLLSWLSLAWMGTEGVVGITTGIIAGSIALTGFGINAFVEGFASLVIVWRFTGSRLLSDKAEARAHRDARPKYAARPGPGAGTPRGRHVEED